MFQKTGQYFTTLVSRVPAVGVFFLLLLGTSFIAYARFNGVNYVILPFLQRAIDPSLYSLDYYITHAIVPKSTPLFAAIGFLHLDITTPWLVVSFYVACVFGSGLAFWRIFNEVFQIQDKTMRVALMFATTFADAKLTDFGKSGWILDHNFSFTFLAAAIRCWFLFFALTGRLGWMCATLIPINLLTFKVGWLPTTFAVALLFTQRGRWQYWALILLSMVMPIWSALSSHIQLDPGEARAMFSALIAEHGAEDNPFGGPTGSAFLYLLGTVFVWFRLVDFPSDVAGRLLILVALSFAVFLFGGVYLSWGYQVWAWPVAVLLSPSRALEMASLVIYVVALIWIIRTPLLCLPERTALFVAALTLKVTDEGTWILIPVTLAAAAVGCAALRLFLTREIPAQPTDKSLKAFMVVVAVLAPVFGGLFLSGFVGHRVIYNYDSRLGFYNAALPGDTAAMLKAVASEPGDRRIVFVQREGESWAPVLWNNLVRKSSLLGDIYYMPRLDQMKELQRQNELAIRIATAVKTGVLDETDRDQLRKLGASIIVPASAAQSLSGFHTRRSYGSWVELEL